MFDPIWGGGYEEEENNSLLLEGAVTQGQDNTWDDAADLQIIEVAGPVARPSIIRWATPGHEPGVATPGQEITHEAVLPPVDSAPPAVIMQSSDEEEMPVLTAEDCRSVLSTSPVSSNAEPTSGPSTAVSNTVSTPLPIVSQ